MTPRNWDRIKAIRDAACEKEGAERVEYIASACEGDAGLQAEVEDLMRYEPQLRNFLETAPGPPRRILEKGQVLLNRFEVTGLLGEGGMGEVYSVKDRNLGGKELALKTLRAERASGGLERKLIAEVLATREIAHPNVCPVYEFFEAQVAETTVCFFTMKLIEGETLGEQLQRGPIEPETALRLARDIASGLTEAQRRGVIHRDLKPGNIMIEQGTGTAVITDLGLARALRREEDTVTISGVVEGTPRYMAPEQFTGGPVTPATDIYAFGLVLCEMITGRRYRPGTTEMGLPQPWKRVVTRCLMPDPADRYATAAEACDELEGRAPRRRIAAAWKWAAAAMLVALLAFGTRMYLRARSALPSVRHVALLGLEAPKGDEIAGQIATGLNNTLQNELTRAEARERDYWVSTYSEARAAGTTPRAIGEKLGANLVLGGRIEPSQGAISISLEVTAAPGGRTLRTAKVTRPRDQLYALTGDAVQSAATLLNVSLPKLVEEGAPRTPEAYRLYQDAVAKLKDGGLQNATAAITILEKVVNSDETFAPGFAMLAEAYANRYYYTRDLAALDLANRNRETALALNPALPVVHFGAAASYIDTGQNEASIRELQRALEIDPTYYEALTLLGRAYEAQDRLAEAQQTYDRILRIRPNSWRSYNLFGMFYFNHGQYERAQNMFSNVIQLAPSNPAGYTNIAGVYLASGHYPEAERWLRHSPTIETSAAQLANLAMALFFQDKLRDAENSILKAIQLGPENDRRWRNLGDIRLKAGNAAGARQAYQRGWALVERQLAATPHNPELIANAALNLAKLSEKEKAKEMIARLPEPGTRDVEIRLRQAMVYSLIGDQKRAIALLRNLLTDGLAMRRISDSPEFSRIPLDALAGAGPANVTANAGNSR